MNIQGTTKFGGKQVWIRPTMQRIEAGSAESQRGAVVDAGGGAQAS